MKHSLCLALILLLTVSYAQAAETPAVVELKELKGGVCFAAFSPDGKKVLTTNDDNTIRIWDAHSGKEVKKLELPTEIGMPAIFSPDGKKIVTILDDGTARILDAESGKELVKFDLPPDFVDFVMPVVFSSDGKKILSPGNNHTFLIRDAESGKELKKLEGHTGETIAFFSPDGKKIVTASSDKTVRIWDWERYVPPPDRPAITDF